MKIQNQAKCRELQVAMSKLKELQEKDKDCQSVSTSITHGKNEHPYYTDEKGILYKKATDVSKHFVALVVITF